jgi:cytochrome P450
MRTPTAVDEIPVITAAGEKNIAIPPGVMVGMNGYGAHLSPRWGHDADKFNPLRFVQPSEKGVECLRVPDIGMFLPWIGGTRVCPGKKFSQVEFVAIVAQILSQYRIEPLPDQGEDNESARGRLLGVLDDKFYHVSAHLKRPEDAGVRFVPRMKV